MTAVRGDMSKLGARRVNCGGKYRPGQGAEGVMSHNAGAGADIQSVLCDLWIKLWTIALVRSPDIYIVRWGGRGHQSSWAVRGQAV